MTWVKVTDGALRDPRLTRLPRGSRLLYLELLAWRNEHLLELEDDLVPYHALRWLSDEPDAEEATVAIVAAGGMLDEGVGWRPVWFVDDQPKREEIAAQRAIWQARQERHRKHVTGDHSKCDAKRCWYLMKNAVTGDERVTNGTSDPIRTDPSRTEGERDGESDEQDRGGQAQAPPLPADEDDADSIAEAWHLYRDPATAAVARKAARKHLVQAGENLELLGGEADGEQSGANP